MEQVINTTDIERHLWTIYMYTFPNGKRYIGKTNRTMRQRQEDDNWSGYKRSPVLWNAICKYGVDNIDERILFQSYMPDEYANRLEKMCILLFKANCTKFNEPKCGYNCTDGGDGTSGWHPAGEQYERRKKQLQEIAPVKKGDRMSEESCRLMSKAKKGKPNPRKGIKFSEERHKKQIEINRNRKHIIPILVTNLITNESVLYKSQRNLCKEVGCTDYRLRQWLNGEKPTGSFAHLQFEKYDTNND